MSDTNSRQLGKSSATRTRRKSSRSTGPTAGGGTTCEPFRRIPPKIGGLIASSEDSRVKMSVSQSKMQKASTENAPVCGKNTKGFLAFYDHCSLSWKTHQGCLFGGLIEFCQDWPRSGLIANGQLFRRARWVRHIHAKGCSLWATPRKSRRGVTIDDENPRRRKKGGCRSLESDLAHHGHRGPVNPTWQEWLMGFPAQWTALDVLATP